MKKHSLNFFVLYFLPLSFFSSWLWGASSFREDFHQPLAATVRQHGTGLVWKEGELQFREQGSFIEIPDSQEMNFLNNGGTMILVCQFADRSANWNRYQFICNKDNSFFVAITDNRYNFSLCQEKQWSLALMGGTPPEGNEWVHLAAVAERIEEKEQGKVGFQMIFYVNGEQIMSKFVPCDQPLPDSTTPLTLGNASNRFGFLGSISEAAFYPRALNETEIAESVKSNPMVSLSRPGIFTVETEMTSRFRQLREVAPAASQRWLVQALETAVMTGYPSDRMSRLLIQLEPVLVTRRNDADLARDWNQAQDAMSLHDNGEVLCLLVRGKGRVNCPLLGVWNKHSQAPVFGERAFQWRIDYRDAQERMHGLVDWRNQVEYEVIPLEISASGGTWRILWQNKDFQTSSELKLNGKRLEADFSVVNQSESFLLEEVTFPSLQLARLQGGRDYLLYPHMSGILSENPTRFFSAASIFPRARNTMQFYAYYDESGNGVYVGQEDPLALTKFGSVSGKSGQVCSSWRTPAAYEAGSSGGNSFQLSGKVVIELFRGDWFAAGQIYRRFLEAEAHWWIKDLPRQSSPAWFRNNSIWILAGVFPDSNEEKLLYLREYFEMEYGVHLVGWTNGRIWPHFNQARPEVLPRLAKYNQAGLRVVPYADTRIWSLTDSEDKKTDWMYSTHGKKFAAKTRNGDVYLERYDVDCAVMCPGAEGWQDWVAGYVRNIANYGFSGVYQDQLAGGSPVICYDSEHGHPLNDAATWLKNGNWPMFEKIHAEMKESHPEFIHTAEDASDPFIPCVDGYMCWRWTDQNHVPLFQSVYSGRIQFVGRLFNHQYPGSWESSFAKMGEQLVYAEQLGWITLEDLECASPLRRYMKKLAWLRKALLKYFNEGCMLPPLDFHQPVPVLTTVWGDTHFADMKVKTEKVLHSVWQDPDGQQMILFLNTVNEPLRVYPKMSFSEKLWVSICREGEGVPLTRLLSPGELPAVDLAPYCAEVWLLNKENNQAEAAKISAVMKTIAGFDEGKTLGVKAEYRFPSPQEFIVPGSRFYPVNAAYEMKNGYLKPYKSGGGDKNGVIMPFDGGSLLYRKVDFSGKKGTKILLHLAADSSNCGGTISLYAKPQEGESILIGSMVVPETGGWYDFKSIPVPLKHSPEGTFDLFFEYKGKTGNFKGWEYVE